MLLNFETLNVLMDSSTLDCEGQQLDDVARMAYGNVFAINYCHLSKLAFMFDEGAS